MWNLGERKKKLIVAFHFHFANQAAWKCDECRANGLTEKRRCGFLFGHGDGPAKPVWIRRTAIANQCPKSLITPDSAAWLDEFFAWKLNTSRNMTELPARTADAFLVLDREWRAEVQNANE